MQEYERIMARVDTTTTREHDCWPWLGFCNPKGYGTAWFRGKKRIATHAMWALTRGSLPPPGMRVLHHCDNPPCMRPSHLWLGTPLDNMRDMIAKGRARHPARYGFRTWSKLNESDVRAIRTAHAAGGVTQESLAVKYGVSRRLIGGIVTGRRWSSVK